jgi:beta-glucosidase-like glycosyl hydrolase
MAQELLQRLAPHMIVGLEGPRLTDAERTLLSKYAFPGVILFERNVADSRQLMELTRGIRSIFHNSRGTLPLIAADHEGGCVSVLGRAIGAPPTQMAAARAGEARLVERLFTENARRMRACGVNMLLGPVADVNSDPLNPVIGTRSFGEEAGAVSSLVSAAVSVSRREGLLTCLKHFPGHGPSRVDSHLELPVLGATLDELKKRDIPPFASGIAAGAETVMIGHIAPLGRALPASLDPEIIDGLLRGELGFGGVVITDALEMEGVKVASLPEICARALGAGNDILLFSKPVAAAAAELEAVGESGGPAGFGGARDALEIAGSLEASAARIARLIDAAAAREREFELPGDAGIYGEIADKSIQILRRADAAAAPDQASGLRVVFYSEKGEFDRYPAMSFVARTLNGLRLADDARPRPIAPGRTRLCAVERRGALPESASHLEGWVFSSASRPDALGPAAPLEIAFLLNRRPLSEEAVGELCSGARTVVIAGWPYAARSVPADRTVLIAWGVYDAAADSLARILGTA